MRIHLSDKLGDGARLVALGLQLRLDAQGNAALALLGTGRAMGNEVRATAAGDQRVLLHQRLRRLAEARRAAVSAVRQGGARRQAGFARNGTRLGA